MRFEILFQCPDGVGLTLSDTAFSDRVQNHVDFARVQIDNGGLVEHFFTAAAPRFDLPRAGAALQSDSMMRYAGLGLSHVYRSADILCFILALLLIVRRRRDFVLAFGALAAGYGVAVLLSAFNLAAPRFATDQALSGLLVLVAAAAAVGLSLPDPRRGAGRSGPERSCLRCRRCSSTARPRPSPVGMGLLAVSVPFLPGRDDQRATWLVSRPSCSRSWMASRWPAMFPFGSCPRATGAHGFGLRCAATLLAEAVLPLGVVAAWFLVP